MVNILVIDDQPHIEELLSEDFSMNGDCLMCIQDATEAMEAFRSFRPDIVLLDLYLQGFEGWDLLHRLKLEDPIVPIIIVTAYDSFIDDPRVAEADGYVIKEFRTDKLKQKIEQVLNRHNHNA